MQINEIDSAGQTLPATGTISYRESKVRKNTHHLTDVSHGWVCPKCDCVYSPSVHVCSMCNAWKL